MCGKFLITSRSNCSKLVDLFKARLTFRTGPFVTGVPFTGQFSPCRMICGLLDCRMRSPATGTMRQANLPVSDADGEPRETEVASFGQLVDSLIASSLKLVSFAKRPPRSRRPHFPVSASQDRVRSARVYGSSHSWALGKDHRHAANLRRNRRPLRAVRDCACRSSGRGQP